MSQIDLKDVNAPTAIAETKKFFNDAQETDVATEISLDVHERTPDGMIELGLLHLELQRDLHRSYMAHIAHWPREQVEDKAQSTFDEINRERSDPIDITSVDETILRRMSEPLWAEMSAEAVAELPEYLQEYVSEFREIDAKLAELSQDESLRQAALEQYGDQMRLAKTAHDVVGAGKKRQRLSTQITDIYTRASEHSRPLNTVDKKRLERLELQLAELDEYAGLTELSPDELDDFTIEYNRLVRRENRRELLAGILLTGDMQDHIRKTLPALVAGRPALFVGETGGAKTAMAETIARRYMQKEPELVSFHGEINVYQLMGKDKLDGEGTSFAPGPVVRAMEEGRPLILDEVNAAPAEFLKRLNIIMQLRPGDTFTIQEDSGKQVVVQPGFCIMATANEKSARYKAVDVMSAEFKNRFGVNVRRVQYPDRDVVFGQLPLDNMALAEAALCDDIGEFGVDLPDGQLEAFVKAAHASQKIFSGAYGDGSAADRLKAFVPGDRLVDNRPGLDDTVLSPRLMVAILEQVKAGLGQTKLTDVLRDWVDGIEKPSDRAVMTQLLDSYLSKDNESLLGNQHGGQ